MAEKRMFAQKIVESDNFLDMPNSAQLFYFHLNMKADDDGIVNSLRQVQRTVRATQHDLKRLIEGGYLIRYDNIVVIRHWRMHNTLRKDRYTPTQYREILDLLELTPTGIYIEKQLENGNHTATERQPHGNHGLPQYSIDKISIDKGSLFIREKPPGGIPNGNQTDNQESTPETPTAKNTNKFKVPTVEEVIAYCEERANTVDAQKFVDYYTANGWCIGKNKMKDWKAAVRLWERNQFNNAGNNSAVHEEMSFLDIARSLEGGVEL